MRAFSGTMRKSKPNRGKRRGKKRDAMGFAARDARALPAAGDGVVCAECAGFAMAANHGSLRDPGFGDDVPADPGGDGAALL